MKLPRLLGGRRVRLVDVALTLVLLLVCVVVKLHYRHAGPLELGWLLAPTAALSARLTGYEFRFEADEGYVSRELGLVIAPACAGANYLVIAFATLVLGFTWRFDSARQKLSWFGLSAALAYIATLLTNSFRIGLSVLSLPLVEPLAALPRAEVHRVQGVLVYLASLLLIYAAASARFSAKGEKRAAVWLPFACYLTITLLAPVASGAYQRPEFWGHAVSVAGLTALVFAFSRALGYTSRA